MGKDLLHLYGETDGAATTGDFSMSCDLIYGTFIDFRLPVGAKLKVWTKRIAGKAVTVLMKMTEDITADTPSWSVLGRDYLASDGELSIEKQKPLILQSITGKEAVRFSWEQPTAGVSSVELEMEIDTNGRE